MEGNQECSANLKPKTGFAPESDSNSRSQEILQLTSYTCNDKYDSQKINTEYFT